MVLPPSGHQRPQVSAARAGAPGGRATAPIVRMAAMPVAHPNLMFMSLTSPCVSHYHFVQNDIAFYAREHLVSPPALVDWLPRVLQVALYTLYFGHPPFRIVGPPPL